MVFSSIPAYNLDPSNLQQQHQIVIGSTSTSPFLSPVPPPQPGPPPVSSHGGGGPGSICPGSMAERARMSNIPVPESALKCPRCESINTKFCYFNNYNFSQPRHFCKTCRRYWTRGGALRSVPVGGGSRRNKRSKPSSSKSTAGHRTQTTSNSTSSPASFRPLFPPLRFTSPMNQPIGNFSAHDMGLNYTTILASTADDNEMNFQLGSIFGGVTASLSSNGGGIESRRLEQVPFLGSWDPSPPEMYQFQGSEMRHLVRPRLSSSILTQMGSVNTEESLELKGQITEGIMPRIKDDRWNGTSSSWTEFTQANDLYK